MASSRRSYTIEDKLAVMRRLREEFNGNINATSRATGT